MQQPPLDQSIVGGAHQYLSQYNQHLVSLMSRQQYSDQGHSNRSHSMSNHLRQQSSNNGGNNPSISQQGMMNGNGDHDILVAHGSSAGIMIIGLTFHSIATKINCLIKQSTQCAFKYFQCKFKYMNIAMIKNQVIIIQMSMT